MVFDLYTKDDLADIFTITQQCILCINVITAASSMTTVSALCVKQGMLSSCLTPDHGGKAIKMHLLF